MRSESNTAQTPPLSDPLPRVLAGYWLAFDFDTPVEVARRRFTERYGREPAEAVRAGALLLVGPIPGRRQER